MDDGAYPDDVIVPRYYTLTKELNAVFNNPRTLKFEQAGRACVLEG